MRYYKLINGTNFVGIGTSYDMLCYQLKHRVFLRCDVSDAQYIRYKETLYRATWMVPESVKNDCILLDVIEIDAAEYEALADAIETEEEIVVQPPTEDSIPEETVPDDVSVEYVREMKIIQMSNACHKTIEQGFDVMLSDGIAHHFSLTTQDQINLLSLSTMIAGGETLIPYHADGELCEYYDVEDMTSIITTATQFKTYHTSYFNSLKNWINTLNSIEDISSITYGNIVPEEYCSVVLNQLNQSLTAVI